jgi:hypothetical protein
MLNGDGFYCAMASACIQLAAVKANNLKGAGKVEHDQQATDLYKQFRACISNENFASLYAPQEAKIVIGNAP